MINAWDFLELGCLAVGFIYLIQQAIINHINLSEYWWSKGDDNHNVP